MRAGWCVVTDSPADSGHEVERAVRPETTAVVISHNHAAYITECLESVRDQTVPPNHLVFVDDGSSDASFDVGTRFVEQHFPSHQLIGHPQPVGLCRSLNEALAHSRGDYLHTIAADDYWMPGKTEVQLGAFARAPDQTVVVYGDALLIAEDGAPLGGTFLERFVPDGLPPDDRFFRTLLRRNFLPAMATMIRRDALVEVGGWDEDLFYEDWDMWLRLACRWPFAHHEDVVAAYRYLPTSMSNARAEEMWLSKLVISRKWAGLSLRADAGALLRSLRPSLRRARHGDWAYARQWGGLLTEVGTRRLRRTRPVG